MQSLSLNNNKRQKTMNSYFTKTANINIIQPPVAFEPSENAFNRSASIVDSLPFLRLREQVFLMRGIHFDNRLSPVLLFNELPKLFTTISGIGNDILWTKAYVSVSCVAENTTGDTAVVNRGMVLIPRWEVELLRSEHHK